jgi:type II secretory pathway pseudopilin PulG
MTTTPQLPDAALSILASDLPDHSTATAVAAILLIAVIAAALLYYVSPMRLTRVLAAAIVATEKTYLEALETGLLSASDVHTAEMLSTWVDPLPSPMYLFDMSIDSSSTSPSFAKGPSATPCLLVQPSANSVPDTLSPSSAASTRCTSSRRTLRYKYYPPFHTMCSGNSTKPV